MKKDIRNIPAITKFANETSASFKKEEHPLWFLANNWYFKKKQPTALIEIFMLMAKQEGPTTPDQLISRLEGKGQIPGLPSIGEPPEHDKMFLWLALTQPGLAKFIFPELILANYRPRIGPAKLGIKKGKKIYKYTSPEEASMTIAIAKILALGENFFSSLMAEVGVRSFYTEAVFICREQLHEFITEDPELNKLSQKAYRSLGVAARKQKKSPTERPLAEPVELQYCGIIITVIQDHNGSFGAHFKNAPGEFNNLMDVSPLLGFDSGDVAILAGTKFIKAHQPQEIEQIGIYTLSVRLWWNEKWGYGIWNNGGGGENSYSIFATRESAIDAGRKRTQEKIAELDKSIAADFERARQHQLLFPQKTALFIVQHARKQKHRHRQPSESYGGIKNPRLALQLALKELRVYKFTSEDTIQSGIGNMIRIAKLINHNVTGSFNNIPIIAEPNSKANELLGLYNQNATPTTPAAPADKPHREQKPKRRSAKSELKRLKDFAANKGFEIKMIDRGENFSTTPVADRFEIWIEGKNVDSKISFAQNLNDAIDKAWPEVNEFVKKHTPGKFSN